MHRLNLFFICTLFFSFRFISLFGQGAHIKEYREINPISKRVFLFPEVIIDNPTVSRNINGYLREHVLELDSMQVYQSIFENIWETEENHSIARISDISYKLLANNKQFLSLEISAEFCSAYCEGFTNYYTFDLKDGKRLSLDLLFDAEGTTEIIELINQNKLNKINEKLLVLENWINVNKTEARAPDYIEDALVLYNECKENYLLESLSMLSFYLTKENIVTFSERCSSHVNRDLDEIGKFHCVLNIEKHQKHLSLKARQLLNL